MRLGNLKRAEEALNRALDVRSPLQFMRETTGAVFDTLAQIHLIRGEHDEAEPLPAEGARGLRRDASRAAGISGRCACSRRALALRRGDADARAGALPAKWPDAADAPAVYALQAELIAIEALLALGRIDEAQAAARRDRRRGSSRAR